MRTPRILIPVLAGAAALAAFAIAPAASAATPQCTAVLGHQCGSWNAEVPGLPDLDVLGGAAVSGNVLIVFTRTNHDKAEDFAVQTVSPAATSKYTVTGDRAPVASFTAGVTPPPANSVMIRYTPFGADSGLCLSSVNPNGFASVQLRPCSNGTTQFNPFQTFTSAEATGDFTAIQFIEVINHLALTDPRNDGSIGVPGARIQVKFKANVHATGQFWGQNGA